MLCVVLRHPEREPLNSSPFLSFALDISTLKRMMSYNNNEIAITGMGVVVHL